MPRLATRLSLLATLAALAACEAQPPANVFPVFFTDFSSTLDPAGQTVVTNAATVAQRFPLLTVEVRGYADAIGSTQQEVALSKARADAVAAQLVADGVAQSRIKQDAVGTPPNSQPGVERRRVEIDIGNP